MSLVAFTSPGERFGAMLCYAPVYGVVRYDVVFFSLLFFTLHTFVYHHTFFLPKRSRHARRAMYIFSTIFIFESESNRIELDEINARCAVR